VQRTVSCPPIPRRRFAVRCRLSLSDRGSAIAWELNDPPPIEFACAASRIVQINGDTPMRTSTNSRIALAVATALMGSAAFAQSPATPSQSTTPHATAPNPAPSSTAEGTSTNATSSEDANSAAARSTARSPKSSSADDELALDSNEADARRTQRTRTASADGTRKSTDSSTTNRDRDVTSADKAQPRTNRDKNYNKDDEPGVSGITGSVPGTYDGSPRSSTTGPDADENPSSSQNEDSERPKHPR
jgi:hypothetical protein